MSLPSLIFDFVPRTPPSWSWKVWALHGRTLYIGRGAAGSVVNWPRASVNREKPMYLLRPSR